MSICTHPHKHFILVYFLSIVAEQNSSDRPKTDRKTYQKKQLKKTQQIRAVNK